MYGVETIMSHYTVGYHDNLNHHHEICEYADESDELETAKLIEVKDKIAVETKPYTKWR